MSISGNLQTMELAELLQWVAQSSKTGTLIIQHEEVEHHIFFREGRIIGTASNEPHRQLGHFFVSRGLVTDEDVKTALSAQESSELLLGQMLVDSGTLSEEDVREFLVQKADESLFEMFLWEEGDFRFIDGEELTGDMVEISLDVTGVVLQAAEKVDDWKRIEGIIPSSRCVPVAVGFLEEDGLSPGSRRVVSLIDDDHTVAKISELSQCSDLFVRQILFSLIEQGKLKIVNPQIVEREDSTVLVDPDDITADTHLLIADRRIANADFHQALRHLSAAHSLDPSGTETARTIEQAEEKIRQTLDEEGIQLNAIPCLKVSQEDLPTLRLSPEEGFVLSRIDGNYDIDSILKISPMPPLDARLVFRKLLKEGHINLELPGS